MMTTASVALTCIAVFAAGLWALGVVRAGSEALAVAQNAVATLRDPRLDDDAREQAVQRASLRLFGATFSILARSAIALVASLLPLWGAEAAGLVSSEAVMLYLSRWDIILVASIVMLAGYRLRTLLWASS